MLEVDAKKVEEGREGRVQVEDASRTFPGPSRRVFGSCISPVWPSLGVFACPLEVILPPDPLEGSMSELLLAPDQLDPAEILKEEVESVIILRKKFLLRKRTMSGLPPLS